MRTRRIRPLSSDPGERLRYVKRATLLLDTTSVGGRLFFVRLALAHGRRAIPLVWRTYEGKSATVGFAGYRELLEEADRLLPRRLERVLLADRGFQHLELLAWCHEHGWLYRVRAKSALGVRLPDGTERSVGSFRSKVGTMRVLDTAYVGAAGLGPVGLVLSVNHGLGQMGVEQGRRAG